MGDTIVKLILINNFIPIIRISPCFFKLAPSPEIPANAAARSHHRPRLSYAFSTSALASRINSYKSSTRDFKTTSLWKWISNFDIQGFLVVIASSDSFEPSLAYSIVLSMNIKT